MSARFERVVGGLMALLSLAALYELWRESTTVWDEFGPGPAFLPGILCPLLLLVSLKLVLWPEPSGTSGQSDDAVPFPITARFAILLAALVAAFPLIGGLPALALFVLLEMLWVERARPRSALLAGLATAIAVHLIFVVLLKVPLPRGQLGWLEP